MKTSIIISTFILICFSANTFSQASVDACFKNPVTIELNSADLKNDPNFEGTLKSISKNLNEGDKLFIYPYSKGSFGTAGLGLITGALSAKANYVFGSDDRFEVRNGGYRNQASVDLFVVNSACQKDAADQYNGAPDLTFFEVDFADAPLGLSVFPDGKEWAEIITEYLTGKCEPNSECKNIKVNIIVGTDGRILYSEPLGGQDFSNIRSYSLNFPAAKQSLVLWTFSTPVINGVPRYVRGTLEIRMGSRDPQVIVWPKNKKKNN